MIVFKSLLLPALLVVVALGLSACASVQPLPQSAGRAAPFDVLGSIAHVTMLETVGLLTKEEKSGTGKRIAIHLQDCRLE